MSSSENGSAPRSVRRKIAPITVRCQRIGTTTIDPTFRFVPADWDGTVRALGVEEFVVVVPADDPAADANPVELATLADRHWVHYAPGNGLADILDQACAHRVLANIVPLLVNGFRGPK